MKKLFCLSVIISLCCTFCFGQNDPNKIDSIGYIQDSLKSKNIDPKNLSPIEGKAIVYIVRPTVFGFAVRQEITCDNYLIGSTKGKQYLYTVLSPGKHIFRAASENISKFELTLEAGKIYFLKQEVKMGLVVAGTALELLSEDDGRKFLSRCKLAKENTFSN